MRSASFRGAQLGGLLVVLLAGSCSDGGGSDGDTPCGPNLKPYRSACVPLLDDCPESQVPVPGGGCKAIGVEACTVDGQTGLKKPPDWTCQPVGAPPLPACQPGWTRSAAGGCEPVLPKDRCSDETLAVIGKATCQPRPTADCGTGTFGNVKVGADTIFVDQAYTGADADGSQSKPWPYISAAALVAPAGAKIVVAAGTYAEAPSLWTKDLTLEGRCAQLVTVTGQVSVAANNVTLRGFTVSGAQGGISVNTAKGVTIQDVVVTETTGTAILVGTSEATLEDVTVKETKSHGLHLYKSPAVTLRRSLISRATGWALFVQGSQVTVDKTVLRETRPVDGVQQGDAVMAHATDGVPSVLKVQDSLFLDNFGIGVFVSDTSATIERSVVRGTQKDSPADDVWKAAIKTSRQAGSTTLVVRDCLVAENRTLSLDLKNADVTVERTTVRDTLPMTWGEHKGLGRGIVMTGEHGLLTVRDSLVDNSRGHGIVVEGARGTIERTIIQHTRALDSGRGGQGIYAAFSERPAEVTVCDCLVQGNRTAGVYALYSAAKVERTVIRDTKVETASNDWGAGIAAPQLVDPPQGWKPSKISVKDSILLDNRMSGVQAVDSTVSVQGCLIKGTRPSGPAGDELAAGIFVLGWQFAADLEVRGTTVTDSWDNGILVASASATIEESVVRRMRLSVPFQSGTGVAASPAYIEGKLGAPAALTLRDCVVDSSPSSGIALFHASGTLQRVAVRRTVPTTDAIGQTLAVGIYAGEIAAAPGEEAPTARATLVLEDSLVDESSAVGLLLYSATSVVKRSIVSNTKSAAGDYGDGIAVYGTDAAAGLSLQLEDSLVDSSARAGLFFTQNGGAVKRSVFRDGVFAVVLDNGADPDIAASNVFEGNQDDRISFGQNLQPVPGLTLPPCSPPPAPE